MQKTGTKKRQRRTVCLLACIAVVIALAGTAAAQQSVEFSSSLNPVGSGARAMGMGGAFIGVADDATAASWNPSGLIQLEKPEMSAVYSVGEREQTYVSDLHPEVNGSNTMNNLGINYLSAAAPLVVCGPEKESCRNVVVSLNYQRLYEMNKKVDMTFDAQLSPPSSYVEEIDFRQKGYLYALSPAAAVQVTPALSLGLTLNIWRDLAGTNGWEQTYTSAGSGDIGGPFTDAFGKNIKVDFEGLNMNAGFLWDAMPWLAVGGVYKAAFDATLTRHTSWSYVDDSGFSDSGSSRDVLNMTMPPSYGIGFKVHPTDSFLVALDCYRTDWSKFLLRDSDGNETNPITGQPIADGHLKPTTQLRMGSEYLFIRRNGAIAVRGGVFTDPQPSLGRVDRYYGFALGTGYATNRFSADIAFQQRMGKNVTGDIISVPDNRMDVTEQSAMASVIYYF